MKFRRFPALTRLSTAALLAFFLIGTPATAKLSDQNADSIKVLQNIAYSNATDDFKRVNHVPIVITKNFNP